VTDSLQFLIMVESDLGRAELLGLIMNRFPDTRPVLENSCDLRGNWVEVWGNEDADPARAGGDDGHLFYAWRVEVTPMHTRVTENEQIALARKLRDAFVRAGARAVVRADFEARV
jgi:hypothetical protein